MGVPNTLTNEALCCSMKLKFSTLSLVKEFKLGKARLFRCCVTRDKQVKNAPPSVITGRKWKARTAVENAESALKMKEIICIVANGRAALEVQGILHKQKKMVSEEIHHLEEVRRIATAVGQRKRCMDQVGECQKIEHGTPKIEFPYNRSLRCFTNTRQPACLGVNYVRPMQSIWENCQPQTYSHWMRVCAKNQPVETTKSLRFLPRLRRYVVRLPIKL